MVGASPSFSGIHLTRVLLILHEKPIGRKRLVQELGVGEGSVRTILKKMWAEGLVESHRNSQRLSEKGERKARKLLKRISIRGDFHSTDVSSLEKRQALVIIRDANLRGKSILDLRDLSVKEGAYGAIILLKKEKGFMFPEQGIILKDYGDLHAKLKEEDIHVGDAAVICWADDKNRAEDAALSIAVQLL